MIKSQKLFEAALLGGGDIIKELKKIKGGKYRPDLPENVAGASGEAELCHKFKEVYCELYNSDYTSEQMVEVKDSVEDRISQESENEVNRVTAESVKAAVAMMKKGKCDVSGSFTTDAIKNATDNFYEHLAAVYRSWLVHGTVSRPLLAWELPLGQCPPSSTLLGFNTTQT